MEILGIVLNIGIIIADIILIVLLIRRWKK